MKTLPTGNRNRAASGAARGAAALTILEMLVSSAMLALIIVGLTAMFVQTQKAFKTGVKQTDVGDAGRSIADLIAGDLSELSDGSPYGLYSPNTGVTNCPISGASADYFYFEPLTFTSTNLLRPLE